MTYTTPFSSLTKHDGDTAGGKGASLGEMTRPEMTPAMKKAAAFVTDEGGITSHAAIISRELKKP
jgi:phosphoenolpyruvate synthase/pyruvate phosphate dikinase